MHYIDIQGEITVLGVCEILCYTLFVQLHPADRSKLLPDIS